MLVLSRVKDEKIVIDQDIVVTVVRISGGRVYLGVVAPGRPVDREEVLRDKLLHGRRRTTKTAVA